MAITVQMVPFTALIYHILPCFCAIGCERIVLVDLNVPVAAFFSKRRVCKTAVRKFEKKNLSRLNAFLMLSSKRPSFSFAKKPDLVASRI
jgi:hypothetical protein